MAKDKKKKKSTEEEYYYVVQNLNLFTTTSCNFACEHCMRGEPTNEDLSDYTISKAFRRIVQIDNLNLNGGEVFLKPEILEKIIDTVIEKNIRVHCLSITTNGTLYTREIERILDKFYSYASRYGGFISLRLSLDKYHNKQLEKVFERSPQLYYKYKDSIFDLLDSPYFNDYNELGNLVNEGRAVNLDETDKIPTKAYPHYCYLDTDMQFKDTPVLYIGGAIGIDVHGSVCETAGIMPALKERCYGNLRTESFTKIAKRNFEFLPTFEAFSQVVSKAVIENSLYYNPDGNQELLKKIQ